MFRNPGPDRSTAPMMSSPRAPVSTSARSAGLALARLARAMAALDWKSARSDRRTTGSAPARSGRTAVIAADTAPATRSSSDDTSWLLTDTVLSSRHRPFSQAAHPENRRHGRAHARRRRPSSCPAASTRCATRSLRVDTAAPVIEKAGEQARFRTDPALLGGLLIAAADTHGKPSAAWRAKQAATDATAATTKSLKAALPS